MKNVAWDRRGLLAVTVMSALSALACSSSSKQEGSNALGELRLPLATHGPSGAEYRLRNATFEISAYCYWDCGYGYGGEGGSAENPAITVSSEDDPAASSISVSLERGEYMVRLLPGWHMERLTDGGSETVEATLLSSEYTWVWIDPHSTSWATYQFGIGGREIWLNGELNIEIDVYEDPNQYYGAGGYGGSSGTGGFPSGGAWMGEAGSEG